MESLGSIFLHPIALLIYGAILGYVAGVLHQKRQHHREDCVADMKEIFYPMTIQTNRFLQGEANLYDHSFASYFNKYRELEEMGRLQPKRFRMFVSDMDGLFLRIRMFEDFKKKTFDIFNQLIEEEIREQIELHSIDTKKLPGYKDFSRFNWNQLVSVLNDDKNELAEMYVNVDKQKGTSRKKPWKLFWDENWEKSRKLCLQVYGKREEVFGRAKTIHKNLLKKGQNIYVDYGHHSPSSVSRKVAFQ